MAKVDALAIHDNPRHPRFGVVPLSFPYPSIPGGGVGSKRNISGVLTTSSRAEIGLATIELVLILVVDIRTGCIGFSHHQPMEVDVEPRALLPVSLA